MISIIFAMGKNNELGYKNKMPWHLPADLAYFKKVTMGKPVIMGRKTFESMGKPLPGRTNIVITRSKDFCPKGCIIADSVDNAKKTIEGGDAFIIGGAEIYKAFLPEADRLYITQLDSSFEADTFFPEIDYSQLRLITRELGTKDEKNPFDYKWLVYERVQTDVL